MNKLPMILILSMITMNACAVDGQATHASGADDDDAEMMEATRAAAAGDSELSPVEVTCNWITSFEYVCSGSCASCVYSTVWNDIQCHRWC